MTKNIKHARGESWSRIGKESNLDENVDIEYKQSVWMYLEFCVKWGVSQRRRGYQYHPVLASGSEYFHWILDTVVLKITKHMGFQYHWGPATSGSKYCETQPPASIGWVALYSLFGCSSFVPHPWHLLSSPLYDVSDHTNHIFSVSIWSWQHVSVNISSLLSWAQFTVV